MQAAWRGPTSSARLLSSGRRSVYAVLAIDTWLLSTTVGVTGYQLSQVLAEDGSGSICGFYPYRTAALFNVRIQVSPAWPLESGRCIRMKRYGKCALLIMARTKVKMGRQEGPESGTCTLASANFPRSLRRSLREHLMLPASFSNCIW